jgi:subtilisin family serine protease
VKSFALPLLLLLGVTATAAPATRYIVALQPAGKRPALRAVARELPVINGFAADLSDDEVAALRKSSAVRYVDPVVERHLLDEPHAPQVNVSPLSLTQTVPYGIDLVHARDVWPYSRGANVNVVIIDTGISTAHPDLSRHVGGWNVLTHSDNFADDNGHGTHVAGTIGAVDNAIGVVGVAPEARIWSVKVLDSSGNGTSEDVVAATQWVLAKKQELGGNWIVSMSFGSGVASQAEDDAFAKLRNADVLCVAAAGNGGLPILDYPAAYPSVLAVGAIDSNGTTAWFSSGGATLGVMAPGVDVLSTLPPGSVPTSVASGAGVRVSGVPFQQAARGDISGAVVVCGTGLPGECGDAAGKIALIKRGNNLFFAEKVRNAVASGAIGAMIINYDDTLFVGTLIRSNCDAGYNCTDDPSDAAFHWPPVVLVKRSDGDKLANAAGPISLSLWDDDYGLKSGTSMAAPHVAGVAALLWSLAPSAHAEDIRRAIELSAHDLGPKGFDTATGNGLIDALAAAKLIAPALFGSVPPQPVHRRSAGH